MKNLQTEKKGSHLVKPVFFKKHAVLLKTKVSQTKVGINLLFEFLRFDELYNSTITKKKKKKKLK